MQQLNKTLAGSLTYKKKSLQNQLSGKHLAVLQCTLQEGNTADRQGSCTFVEKGLLVLNHG